MSAFRATGFIGAISAWLLSVHGVVPVVIRIAYAEKGPAWLSSRLSGRALHPLDHYLDYWSRVAWKLDALLLVAVTLFLARRPLASLWNRIAHADPAVRTGELLATAALFGFGTGALEGLHIFLRKLVSPLSQATLENSPDALWMAPLGEMVFMMGIAAGVALIARTWRKGVSLRLALTVFSALGFYALLRSTRLGIGVWPCRILAAGLALRLSTWLVPGIAVLLRKRRLVLVACAAWTLVTAVVPWGVRAAREWWMLAGLPAPSADAPNVVLVILDTVRALNLSLYGHEHPTTPRLEQLARESAVIDGAVSVTSWTLPAHASMLTGRFPWELNVAWTIPLDGRYPTLAEILSRRGYASGGFMANMTFAGRSAGMARGFSHFVDAPVTVGMLLRNSWLAGSVVSRTRATRSRRGSQLRDARTITDGFLRWASRHRERPHFALLNFMDAHAPYTSPDSIQARFMSGQPLNLAIPGRTYGPGALAELHASYDAAIAYLDHEIGRIVDSLRAWNRLDRTILIITADHGEHIGERDPGLHGHGNSLYAASIDVPLIIRYPQAVPRGIRVRQTVSTQRIAATILSLMGAEASSPLPGRSLVSEFAQQDSAGVSSVALSLLRPHPAMLPADPIAAGPIESVRSKRWHYLRNADGAEELYDVAVDPWELRNRLGDPELKSILDRLRSQADMLPAVDARSRMGSKQEP